MSTIIAIVYPNKEVADEVCQTVNRLQAMGLMDLLDACVAVRKDGGKVKLEQAYNLPLLGATNGIFLGALVGLFFMFPGIGAVAGAIAGTLGGKVADIGINDGFMKELALEVLPGKSVLFLYVREAVVDKVVPEIAIHGGRIMYTSLSVEQEKKLMALFNQEGYGELAEKSSPS